MYLESADKAKYGSLLTGLTTQKALGTDQFPTTLTDAIEVLSNRPFDKGWNDNYKKKKKEEKNDEEEDEEPPALTMAQMEGKCYCCGKKNHRSNKCPEKNKRPKEEWEINKAATAANLHTVTSQGDAASITPSTASKKPEEVPKVIQEVSPQTQTNIAEPWQLTMMFKQSTAHYKQQMKDKVILDSGSLINVFTSHDKSISHST